MSVRIQNKKARHKYFISDTVEAGIVLQGSEVKAIREGRVSLGEGYARVKNDEVFLYNTDIAEYSHTGYGHHKPKRVRKLLLHKKEVRKLFGKVSEKGFTLIPLELYFSRGWAKVKIGVAKSKSQYDKRESMRKKDAQREIRRAAKAGR